MCGEQTTLEGFVRGEGRVSVRRVEMERTSALSKGRAVAKGVMGVSTALS